MKIIKEWSSRSNNPPSIKELIKLVFEDNFDERGPEGVTIKNFLASKCKGYKVAPILSEENKEYVRNNSDRMTATEMARIIFNNPKLFTGHPETRAIRAFKETLEPALMYKNEKTLKDFKPPQKEESVIKIVNNIVLNAFNTDQQDGATKKCLNACIDYLNNERFLSEIENYQDANERKMFINNFIRHIYNKPDLTQQDLDTLILYSKEIIEHKRHEDHMSYLMDKRDSEEDAKMSMALVEAMDKTTTNLSQSKKTQASLLKEINEKRSDRLKKEAANHNSLLNLTNEWKEEESRKKILQIAENRKKILGEEIDKLDALEAFHASIFGNTKDELLYG